MHSLTPHPAYSIFTLEDERSIRTVILHPGSMHNQHVSVDLAVMSLDDDQRFEALSYTWGPSFEGDFLEIKRSNFLVIRMK